MVLYHIDSNTIWAEAMKNKTEGEMILVWARALAMMKATGFTAIHQVLSNEASALYK